jgi:hypothetical protein
MQVLASSVLDAVTQKANGAKSLFFVSIAHLVFGFQAFKKMVHSRHFIQCFIDEKLKLGNPADVPGQPVRQRLLEAVVVIFHCQYHLLFVFRIKNTEVNPGHGKIRGYLYRRDRDQGSGAVNVGTLLLKHDAEMPFYRFCYLFLAYLGHALLFKNVTV